MSTPALSAIRNSDLGIRRMGLLFEGQDYYLKGGITI